MEDLANSAKDVFWNLGYPVYLLKKHWEKKKGIAWVTGSLGKEALFPKV